jgi:hypothetical protein
MKTKSEQVPYADEVIINDKTDPHKLRPSANAHIISLRLSENKGREITVRYMEIVDKKTTPVYILHLPNEAVTNAENVTGTMLYREYSVLKFIDTVRKTLSPIPSNGDTGRLQYSEIFSLVANELTALNRRQATIKRLFLYSDLQERSSTFNCYSKQSQQLLAHHIDKVVAKFRSQAVLPPNLKGITVYVIYQPISREEDQKFTAMVMVYRRLLEPLGVIIVQQAQNKSFEESDELVHNR